MQDLPTSFWTYEQIEQLIKRVIVLEEELELYKKYVVINDDLLQVRLLGDVYLDGRSIDDLTSNGGCGCYE